MQVLADVLISRASEGGTRGIASSLKTLLQKIVFVISFAQLSPAAWIPAQAQFITRISVIY